ncbi:Alpha/Beta hydrolase protein [Mycena olivaceomarginata]|nr:Alpha/Beta hydrolase protein [Mycena olivaceomarginata]
MLLRYSLVVLGFSPLLTAFHLARPIANTSSGSYVGFYDAQNQVDRFLGLRFASPPTQRFTPTIPVSSAPKGLQNATTFGADCPQLPAPLSVAGFAAGPPLRGANQSEDCFFVNVWRPAGTLPGDKLPILIYIFGGGYFSGSGSEWEGTNLVRRSVATKTPIIYITFNYRTGVLGFIGSAMASPSALNVGLQDQRDAFRWIQDNAEAFGGDGSRITISGESAGGSSVHMHYLYPDSRRTFRAGISSSGTSLVLNTPACEWHDRPGGAYTLLGNVTGCGSGPGSFECLQNLPFDTFWPLALTTYLPSNGVPIPPWSVTCKGPQGSLIEEYPVKKVINGDFLDLPIITGTNKNEGNFVIGTSLLELTPQPPIDVENTILSGFIAAQATNFKNVSQATLSKLLDLYAHPTDDLSNSTLFDRATQFETDYSFLGPQRLFLKTASAEERKQDVWAYSFQQHLPGSPDFFGAFHTSDLYYLDMGFPIVPAQKLKSQIQDIYISFVNDLSPGIFWPKYAEESKIVMRLQDGSLSPIVDTVRRNLTDFLNQVDVMEEFGRFG